MSKKQVNNTTPIVEWSSERPMEPGWYWLSFPDEELEIVQVKEVPLGYHVEFVGSTGHESLDDCCFDGAQWSRIEMPEAPKK